MSHLGIYSWFGFRLPLEQRLCLIRDAGFTATCFWFGHEEELVSEGRADEIPELVRSHELWLDNVHAPFYNMYRIWSDNSELRNEVSKELGFALEYCGEHHIPIMVMHPEGGRYSFPPNETGLMVLRNLVHLAESVHVTIALENVKHPEYIDYALASIDSPNLGFCYDSSHDYLSGGTKGHILEKWGYRLVTTHLSDNLGVNDDHFIPGKGSIDWTNITSRLSHLAYNGVLMLEIDGPESQVGFTPRGLLSAGYEQLRYLQSLLNYVA